MILYFNFIIINLFIIKNSILLFKNYPLFFYIVKLFINNKKIYI